MAAKPPTRPKPVLMTELVLPQHTNDLGTIFGGQVMSWIDIAGAIAGRRHAHGPVVTVSIDYMHFVVPIKLGYTVLIHAHVTYTGRTSMEVEVRVDAENTTTGETRRATNAYLTYVAVDEFGRARPVPPMILKTAEEKRLHKEAEKRRAERLKWISKSKRT